MRTTDIDAVIFDLDGVITNSTPLHSSAWKEMFDQFLKAWSDLHDIPFREFTHEEDYLAYVDGKPRYIGVKSFLESRGIELPFGDPSDLPGQATVCALGNLKNELYNQYLTEKGVEVYASSVEFIHQLREAGISLGLATSSKNAARVLDIAGLSELFQTIVDGVVSAELKLMGKPAPDIFQTACDRLNASSEKSVIVEDANSGVQAGFRGNFGLVLGVARENNREELELHGADLVIEDLSEIDLQDLIQWFSTEAPKKSWWIEYTDYDPEQEGTRETLCAVGNGYFCTRGSLEENPAVPDLNYPGTYIAGMYNTLESQIAGRTVSNEDFVNCPNWLPISFRIGTGEWVNVSDTLVISFHRKLDLKTGLLTRSMVIEDADQNRTRIQAERFASMADPHLGGQRYTITPLNYAGKITIRSELDGTVTNQGVQRYRDLSSRHLEPVQQAGEKQFGFLEVVTNQSQISIAMAAKLQVLQGGRPISPEFKVNAVPGRVSTTIETEARSDSPVCIEKVLVLHSSNAPGGEQPLKAVRLHLEKTGSYNENYQKSAAAWQEIWDEMDLSITGDRLVQKMIRLHIYHALVSVSRHSALLDAGIPARGLHGEAYRGHIFWDELYVLPFYNLHLPETARAALMYRYRRLPAARESAARDGLRGAQFPWQSGSDGSEQTQSLHLNPISGKWGPDYSHYQRHVSLAIAYNLWNYYLISGDLPFLQAEGGELFLSICLYWADKSRLDSQSGRYSINQVMGPDEFHETYPGSDEPGLKDNAYTNIMAAWMFNTAEKILDLIPGPEKEHLLRKLNISPQDLAKWQDLQGKLTLSISQDGILEQFAGYFNLRELDWEHYRSAYQNIDRMDRILKSEGHSPNDYKVAKQADTLMLFYNLPESRISNLISRLGYDPPQNLLAGNLHYYLQRTSHGSTLSRLVHAYLAHSTQNYELSWKFYQEALRSDFLDIQGGTTQEGIHLGVMAGTVLFAYRAYAGLDWSSGSIAVSPRLPTGWEQMAFKLRFQGDRYHFQISQDQVRVMLENSHGGSITINGQPTSLEPGKWTSARLSR